MKIHNRVLSLFAAAIVLLNLQGCASMGDYQRTGIAVGMTTGAVLGAVLGNQVGNPRTGAAIGAALGSGIGSLFGSQLDAQKRDFETALASQRQAQAVQVAAAERAVLLTLSDRAFFKRDSDEIDANGYDTLHRIAQVLTRYPASKVTITGYADATGRPSYNLALSQRRALMVAAYLMLQGIDTQRITVQGKGSADPIASNRHADGRQLNRRVEIAVTA